MLFCCRHLPSIVNDPCMTDIGTLVVVFISSYGYLQNPYLAAKLVEIMYVINPAVQPNLRSLSDSWLNHALATDHLVPALMSFYTGKAAARARCAWLACTHHICESAHFQVGKCYGYTDCKVLYELCASCAYV